MESSLFMLNLSKICDIGKHGMNHKVE